MVLSWQYTPSSAGATGRAVCRRNNTHRVSEVTWPFLTLTRYTHTKVRNNTDGVLSCNFEQHTYAGSKYVYDHIGLGHVLVDSIDLKCFQAH